jgi:membrane-bound inhibitor of C-type lysozyme
MALRKSIAAVIAGVFIGFSACFAQETTFRTYRCADGSEFIVGFYPHDSRAYVQIDGDEITLSKRLAISGARYASRGVTLKITKDGLTTVRRPKRAETACEVKNFDL